MGSVVIDVNGNRLDARFLRETGAIDDHFTILKGMPAEPLRMAMFRADNVEVHGAWKSVAGNWYEVETSTEAAGGSWTLLGDAVLASGATTFWTNAVVGEKRFYRVRQTQPW
jgi:hypothetical protein